MRKNKPQKRKGRNKSLTIMDRDIELFRYLFIHKGAKIEQIRKDVFTDVSKQFVYYRIGRMVKLGLLEVKYFKRGKHCIGVYSVTKKALSFAFDLDEDLERQELKSSNLEHDFTLVDIARCFKQVACLNFYATENEIESGLVDSENFPVKQCKELHSDALLGLLWNGQYLDYAIEFENSVKSYSRYENVLKAYYAYPQVNHVIFITKDRKASKAIMSVDKKILKNLDGEISKVFVVNINELRSPFQKMRSYNFENEFVEFNFKEQVSL